MKIRITIAAFILSSVTVAQIVPYWKLGGNPSGPPFTTEVVNTTNNYLGTASPNNTWIQFGVQGSQDIMIDNDNSKLLPADGSGRLHGGHWIGMGRVFTPTNGPGANAFWTPKAHLHIDGGNNSGQWGSFGNGLRTWMNTGTLYTENSDAMYVGLKSVGNNFSYAMINWSDDAYGGSGGSDFLSFNFTGGPAALQQSTNGTELGRFNPTQGRGTLGVGNFQFLGTSTEPVRRLEILDADPATGTNANAPQLRTTYTYNTTPTAGIFTEFQTTSAGDMYFNTRNGANEKNFGFHKFNPQNCVEITSHNGNTGFLSLNGSSGLRFTNMTSANTPQVNPGAGVLSVDANGDVIYVPGGGAGIANNGVSVNAGVTQLGVPCSIANIPAIIANQFTTDRIIANRNQNLWIASLNNETGGMGVGGQPVLPFCNLGNTFEISANSKNTQYGTAGSGLRFTKLTSSSATIPNGTNGVNSNKVLTVDGDGDVVLTDANAIPTTNNGISINAGVVQLGVDCSSPIPVKIANRLLTDRMIHLNGKNMIFADGGRVGIGQGLLNCAVGNKLEINSGPGMPYWTVFAVNGSSGLRLTHLTSAKTPIANGVNGVNTAKVLSVDANGDVVLVDASAGNFGVDCGSPTGGLLPNDWRVGMNGHSVNFDGTGNVNIGDLQGCVPGSTSPARLWVRNTFGAPNPNTGFRVDNVGPGTYAGYFSNGDVLITNDAYVNSSVLVTSDKNVKTNVLDVKNPFEIINKLRPVSYDYDNTYAPQMTFDAGTHYGFIAQEVEQVLPHLVKEHDVYGRIDSLGNTIDSTVTIKALNYDGLIPFAISGIQELNAKQKEMQATLDKAGLSDAQVKTNVNTFNALATVKTLSPVKYNFTNANVPQLNFKPNTDYGFIAQQLETVYPELVDTIRIDATYDSLGVVVNPSKVLKTVNYKAISALLVRSIQEQQLTIDSLRNVQSKQDSINQSVQQQLAALASQINSCCSNTSSRNSNSNINQLDVELSDKDAIVLNQNVPNPFAEQTTITYNVPTSVEKAQLIFFNANGQVIQTVDIKTRGKGKVNVFASDLSSGLYHYTLVVDGKVVDSKKMVRE
ncbi:MAG TPA: tail fiber domain-containing protein [Bacteroidia bacterium]|nr:tail fiber domain-containing protein [Bacteroidia bacterium]